MTTRRKFTTTLDSEVIHESKVRAAVENVDLSQVIEGFLAQWLEDNLETPSEEVSKKEGLPVGVNGSSRMGVEA